MNTISFMPIRVFNTQSYQNSFSSSNGYGIQEEASSKETELKAIKFGFNLPLPELVPTLEGSRILSWSPQSSLQRVSPSNIPDLYMMLSYVFTDRDDREKYKMVFKRAIEPYTVVTNKGSIYLKKMIKIVGADNRFDHFPKTRSMHGYNGNRPFSVSKDGAMTLCEIIREDRTVRYFMFIAKSKKGSKDPLGDSHIGDETVRILAYYLPRDRFHLLKIGGAFGNEAAIDLLNQIPYLLRCGARNPRVHIYGDRITEKEICDRCSFFANLKLGVSQKNFEK